MERFFKLLYYYCLGAVLLFVVYLTAMLALSPKKDALKRGFIPCTEKFVQDIGRCERGQTGCLLGRIAEDMQCNTYVIFDGFGAWIKGNQKTPWAAYLFEPTAVAELDEENPYEGNVAADMENFELQRSFLENRHRELEAAKSREMQFDESVLLSQPDQAETVESETGGTEDVEEYQPTAEESDISDEAYVEEFVVDDNNKKVKENVEEKDEREGENE